MTTETQTTAAIETQTTRSPLFLLRAIGGGLAASAIVLANLACGCGGIDSDDFTWGCLVEGEVDGDAAQAQAETDANGTVVRLAPSFVGESAHGAVITIPGASLESIPFGEQPIEANITVSICEGHALAACVPVHDVVVDVTDLGEGLARASYSGTTTDLDGRELPAEGSFVFVRTETPRGI